MSHIVFRLVYSSSEDNVPKIQYLASEDSLFAEFASWRWRDHKHQAHHFPSGHVAQSKANEMGERHAMIVPLNSITVEKKKQIPPDEVYRNTCKRLGEHEY